MFDRAGGQEIQSGEHEDAGVIGAFETSDEKNCRGPEEAPEAERDYTFNPDAERVSKNFHRPNPEPCKYWTDEEKVVKEGCLESAADCPAGSRPSP